MSYKRFGCRSMSKSRPRITCEKDNRIKAAHTVYGTLSHLDFNNHGLIIRSQIMVFRVVILSNFLYVWSCFSKRNSEESFASVERTASPPPKSSLGCLSLTSRLPSFIITLACLECVLINSYVSSCLKSSLAVRGYVEAQNVASRTQVNIDPET